MRRFKDNRNVQPVETSMYSTQLLDHFQNPRNVGELESASACVQVENPACGDVMKLWLRVADGRVQDARFRAKGCVAAIACGSALTELVHGKELAELKKLEQEQLVGAVGGLPPESLHASHLAFDALTAALTKLT
jgi:nitrogen fixation protein NifU and related proteins